MNSPLARIPLLQIRSPEPDTIRKGQLLQWLLLLFALLSLIVPFLESASPSPRSSAGLFNIVFTAVATLVFGLVCLYLVHIGRVTEAAHIFAIVLMGVIFVSLMIAFTGEQGLPYLLLLPILMIATLDKIRASMVYAMVAIMGTAVVTAVTPLYTTLDFATFLLVFSLVSLTTWMTVHDLQGALSQMGELAQESLQKTELLQKRAHQLQHSAQIGQQTGTSFDLPQLLQETAQLVQQEFDFYHVAIFLLAEDSQKLTLKVTAGRHITQLSETPFHLPVDEHSIIGWTAVNRLTRIADNVTTDPHYLANPRLLETRSEMALPLITRDRVLGVLDVQSRRESAFQEEDAAFLQIVANQLAINIDNSFLFGQTEATLQEMRALYQYNTLLTTSLDVGEIYRRAARTLAVETGSCRCIILVWQPGQNCLTTQIGFEQDMGPTKQAGFFWDTAVYDLNAYPHLHQLLTGLETAVYHQPATPPATPEQLILAAHQAATGLVVPMIRGTETTGMVWLFRHSSQPAFQPAEIQLAQAMANQTAVALTNAQLASDTQVRVAYLSTLNRMSVIFSHAPTLKAIFDGARRETMALIPATGMSIFLLTKDGQHMNWIYGYEFGHEVDLSSIPPLPITQGFSGHVVRTREMLYIDKDDVALRQKLQTIVVGENLDAWLGLPMIVSGELVGVLAVENEESFSEREIELLKTIVGPLASAIHNFIQLDELQVALAAQSRQHVQLQTAAEVAAAATSVPNLEELVQASVNLMKERFSLYYVGLFLVDYENYEAVLVAGTGEAGRLQVQEGRRLRVGGKSLIGGATGNGLPRITQDVSQDEEWLPNPYLPHTRSELALPLRVRGRVIGALTSQSEEPHLFTVELIQVFQTLADQLATAIENARLLSRVEARAQRQQTLTQIGTRLHQTADVEEIIHIGLQAISNHLDGASVKLNLGKGSKTK